MSEVLFILTTLYVAYVIYKVADEPKSATPAHKPSSVESIITPSGAIPMVEKEAVQTEVVVEVEPVVEAEPVAPISSSTLKDPDTGEIAKVTNNYRSLKRWLKEALVAEGLLEKVYSNSELNDETNAKIKVALEAIKFMSKYHA
jgi:hypothetical protein